MSGPREYKELSPRSVSRARAEKALERLRTRTKAFRYPKGQSGNPNGQARFYHEARRIAREAGPEMMYGLIELACEAEDERVRSVCLTAVLDRGGLKPIDFDPDEEAAATSKLSLEERKARLAELTQRAALLLGLQVVEPAELPDDELGSDESAQAEYEDG
jgi:hypothetical protein